MDAAGYTTLTRQVGLMREMDIIANNIANAATSGYRQQGLMFSEHVQRVEGAESLSMASANISLTSGMQGSLTETGGTFDFAIEGDGFFMIETPSGPRLTRAGSFSPNNAGDLVTPDGYPVLDIGEAPIFIPPDATALAVSEDGTISSNGRLIGQIGVFNATNPNELARQDGVMLDAPGGVEATLEGRIKQGFIEGSNVNAILQVARMIEVQRAYEMGQSFLDTENERVRSALQSFMGR